MRVLIRSYDIDDLGGSGITLRTIARYLEERGHTVWATNRAHGFDEIASWSPDLVMGQQWATDEAGSWATRLRLPFVMLVHGPGQFEQFMPQCDLVIFNTRVQMELARAATGQTPAMVVHPPVVRALYETEGAGDCLTLVGTGPAKGAERFLRLAQDMPHEKFLLVTDDEIAERPANLIVQPKVRDVREIYARTKLLLMPSEYESYGRVAVEAAMSGIPTVASDLPGIREATDGHAVFVAEGDDWQAVVREALGKLEALRERARALALLRDAAADLEALHTRLVEIEGAGRRRPTISLCMTVANEAQTIERAVKSVEPFVDQIIIGVDLKSSDETATIARRLATTYFEYEEESPPNFPRMRNRAMQMVETDWAIVVDGHEWIEHAELIAAALETTAWSIEIQTLFEPDERRVPALSFPFPRIHRRHVRFTGAAAHEEISAPFERRDSRLEIKVWHERKPGQAAAERSREKTGRELEHLRAAWEEQGDARALFYLANGLREAGRYGEAIAAYEQYLRAPNFPEEGWQALLYSARCHAERKEWAQARSLFERAVLQCPERAEASVGLGYLLLETGDALRAAAWFRMAAALPEPRHCRLFVEVPTYRWGAWHGLALALARLGDYAGAVEAEGRARDAGAGPWADMNIKLWMNGTGADKGKALVGSET
ncbi:MAG TPA: glycosyltransferase [Pyrinomonadaceae bacterium]|jgi:glycosyltransferase involved in cell wall biosynthesis